MRIVLYADVDLNYIDGSSVWLVSVAEAAATIPDTEVDILLKAPLTRTQLTAHLGALDNVTLHSPPGRQSASQVPGRLGAFAESTDVDVAIVRGLSVLEACVEQLPLRGFHLWGYLTDIPQRIGDLTTELRNRVRRVLEACDRSLFQTEELLAFVVSQFPGVDEHAMVLPPMVPDRSFGPVPDKQPAPARRFVYAGKFAPEWAIEEMLASFDHLRSDYGDVELHIAGDKVHRPLGDPSYHDRVVAGLQGPGVVWHGGITREEVAALIRTSDLALAVRRPSLDDSLELSTKLLEYAAAGVPFLANRSAMHERVFGAHSPFLINGPEALPQALAHQASTGAPLAAIQSAQLVAEEYSLKAATGRIAPAVRQASGLRLRSGLKGRRVVVAGHSLKFVGDIMRMMERAGAETRIDRWQGHNAHDVATSLESIAWADTILCEWALGNAVFYSQRSLEEQKLVIRLHRSELESALPFKIDEERVDTFVFVSEHTRSAAMSRFGWSKDKCVVVPNSVDPVSLDRPKLPESQFNLGLLGYVPRLKRLDRALDLLGLLRRADPRYRMILKGHPPWEYQWVWSDPKQSQYYEEQWRRMRTDRLLRDAIEFDSYDRNVPTWFQKVGHIVSSSEVESFHLALLEGMASRAVPTVADREGASEVVDAQWVMTNIDQAADAIQGMEADQWSAAGAAAREETIARYSPEVVANEWAKVLGVRAAPYGHGET